jgi:hypothetical protein
MLKAGSWGRKKRPQDELPSGGPFKPAFGLSGAVPRLDGVFPPWTSTDTAESARVELVPFPVLLEARSSQLSYRDGGVETCLAESHAAAVKTNVVTIEKTIGIIKKYFQLKKVMAAKQRANVHAVPRMSARDSGGRRPSCHANTTASRRNAVTKSPNPR